MIERLPTPWGLVRLGVAPDHPNIKAVSRAFEKIAAQPGFRFFGNVDVGSDVTHEELAERYDAVLYAVGAQTDRQLGIPGEDLPGSWRRHRVRRLVQRPPRLPGARVRPVARARGRDRERQRRARRRAHAGADAGGARPDRHHGCGDRGDQRGGRAGDPRDRPARAGAGRLDARRGRRARRAGGADILVDPRDMRLDAASEAELEASPPTVKRNVDHLRGLRGAPARGQAARDPPPLPRVSRSRSSATRRSRRSSSSATSSSTAGQSRPTRRRRVPCGIVFRSVGYRGVELPGVPVRRGQRDDPERGRSRATRVSTSPAGSSAARAASSARTRRTRPRRSSCYSPTPVPASCPLRAETISRSSSSERGVDHVLYSGWEAIDCAERTAGEPRGRPRVKLCTWDELLEAARTPGA